MSGDFYYLKIVKCRFEDYECEFEEYFIHPNYVFKIRPEGMKIFDNIDNALDYKSKFLETHKMALDIKWSEIQICRL